jgi:RimJ/RimL family protein N-acetyltransferase
VLGRVDDLQIRALSGVDELELFGGLQYTLDDELEGDLVNGVRRPAWMWVALRGGRLLARAAWWGDATAVSPSVFDFLDLSEAPDRVEVGVRLVTQAHSDVLAPRTSPPDYVRFVAPDWREQPDTRRLIDDLTTIVAETGAELVAERFRFEWRPGTSIAVPTGRLSFRAAVDDHELLALMTAVLDGTLDAYSRRDLRRMSAPKAAARHFRDELASYKTPREWWQIATLPGGEPVGFVIPAHNSYGPIIAYIGVLPAHRGHGYINEILAQGSRTLAEHQAPRIRASTDLDNVPMARAFTRAGWSNFERSINMTWQH